MTDTKPSATLPSAKPNGAKRSTRSNAKRAKSAAQNKIQAPKFGPAFSLACAALGAAYVSVLVVTARTIGYSRDESFYFDAARRHADWYRLLIEHRVSATTQAVVDGHFGLNHEHPPLIKTLFGLSYDYLFKRNHWVAYEGLSYRLPTMVIAGLCIALVGFWGARSLSRTAGLVAALSLVLMPRFFHHAHLACFDVPVASLCLASAFAWSKALDSGKLRWALLLGLVYGLTLATKHNAWLLPPALLLHAAIVKGKSFWRDSWGTRLRLLLPILSLVTVAPLVLYTLWPWLWFDTMQRLKDWYAFHARHDYYNMEFLGFTYWKPPMPLGYAWIMTLATVPLTTLVLFASGVFAGARSAVAAFARAPSKSSSKRAPIVSGSGPQFTLGQTTSSDWVLWVICIVAFYSPWLSSQTPIFGGTKHWMTAYPFLALVAGLGFHTIARYLPTLTTQWRVLNRPVTLRTGLAAVVLLPGFFIVKDMGPWGLSTYTPIVGGASGAATLGLNRTFWGYTTIALASDLKARAPGRVYLHDMTGGAFDMQERDGTLPRDLYGTYSITDSDLALYHHEPHMERVEYQIWSAYRTATPAAIGAYQGVPVAWMFDRRAARK